MKNLETIMASAAMLLACATASAQNFNPTVEVTNAYQGPSAEITKPQLEMNIPDSLMRFDLNFDYEVFDKPYEGSYSFKPYMLNLTPAKDAYRGHKLYLKVGAGYSLHPQLDFVYSPDRKGPLQLSVYASHRSYFGKYSEIMMEALPEGGNQFIGSKKAWKGYDAVSKAGFDGRYSWEKAVLTFGAGYYGLLTKDTLSHRSYNALDFNVGIKSNCDDDRYFFYDVAFNGRLGSESMNFADSWNPISISSKPIKISDGTFALHGTAGPVFNPTNKVLVGFDAITARCGNMMGNNSGLIAVTPSYVLEYEKFVFNLGARLEYLAHSQTDAEVFGQMHVKRSNTVYPAVEVTYTPFDYLRLYADATGGADLNTYSSIIDKNHHYTPAYYSVGMVGLDNTLEAVKARLGVKGNFKEYLQFDVNGGLAVVKNGLRDSYRTAIVGANQIYVPCYDYQDYNYAFVDALLAFAAGKVRMDAGLHYRKTFYADKDAAHVGFEMPAFCADSKVTVNVTNRIYAGMNLSGSTCRRFNDDKIPGYLDMGLFGGYQINRRLGAWLESGNILCETIQRNFMYAEKGLWATVGITLTL